MTNLTLPSARSSVTKPASLSKSVRLSQRLIRAVSVVTLAVGSSACGETESGGTETTSDASGSSTGSSGSSSSTSSSVSGTSTSSGVGTSGSSSATTAQTTTGSSATTTSIGSTGTSGVSSGVSTTTTGETTGTAGTSDGDAGASTVGDAATTEENSTSGEATSGDPDDGSMSFFVSSVGHAEGGNLGGLEGADAFCSQLAAAVSESLGNKTWRAYLSTSTVNAKDRIGNGPWRNAEGVIVANTVEDLHAQEAGAALDDTWPPADLSIALTENGDEVPNSIHDILTGSLPDGTVDADRHCNDWTSSENADEAGVGHSNRDGGGRPPYFNATHQVGCAPSATNYQDGTVTSGGGQGSIYCFALTLPD